ncbi:uncharacterized protein LOC131944864 [Physella acuta]|uniref:uncharacterized protein LOC131944864 n=1 Tax=Physella acuta TaxID=109671 RepID=UPI0027DE10A5|nr:uncharacterized protein LOC131944864 [Physella acuta]XP_059161718.1 uncharacterized protein LOC131944864 [Physella acuta]XP_059161719.1 uncharacterized protein LOC131944864 [Physella acuta]XP_059161720.1 uncharacterized protein LOC131944864 [Physella acuta]
MSSRLMEKMETLFKFLDKDSNGYLDECELTAYFERRGLSTELIEEQFRFFDGPDGNKKIVLEEFLAGWQKMADLPVDLRKLAFEYDEDKDGFLTRPELKALVENKREYFLEFDDADQLVNMFDTNKDGRISIQEFNEGYSKYKK